jgi:hypothetical protein
VRLSQKPFDRDIYWLFILSLIKQSGDIKLAEHGIAADRCREVELLLKKINLPGAPKLHQP